MTAAVILQHGLQKLVSFPVAPVPGYTHLSLAGLAAVLEVAPDYKAARAEYAEVLIEMHKCSQALRELDRLQQEDPEGRLRYEGLRATALVGLGEHARAVEVYQALIRLTPQDPDLHLSVAHALKTLGRREEAIAEYRQAEASRLVELEV